MQKAKDTFFAALRDRLAVVNPDRTMVIDGQTRPGILVCENESAGIDEKAADLFCVEWGASTRVATAAGSPVAIDCTIDYRTAGSEDAHGLDRGRKLAALDEELARILEPRSTQKMDFANGGATPLPTRIFWSHATMGAAEENGRYLARVVTLRVHFYPEANS